MILLIKTFELYNLISCLRSFLYDYSLDYFILHYWLKLLYDYSLDYFILHYWLKCFGLDYLLWTLSTILNVNLLRIIYCGPLALSKT